MDIEERIVDMQRSLGRIEVRVEEIPSILGRISKLEQRHAWMKGIWAAVAAGLAYLLRGYYGK